jgi:hypothetical protein
MMCKALEIGILLAAVGMINACGQSNNSGHSMETKHSYSLCPKTDDSRRRLYEQAKNFADQQGAQFIDRSAGVQSELTNMKSSVLESTGGNPVLVTVEKPNKFRISITNLGLKEKFALAVGFSDTTGEDGSIARFLRDVERFWTIQEVDESVTNDPPCSSLDVSSPSEVG